MKGGKAELSSSSTKRWRERWRERERKRERERRRVADRQTDRQRKSERHDKIKRNEIDKDMVRERERGEVEINKPQLFRVDSYPIVCTHY